MKQRTLVLGVRLGVIAMSGLYGHLVVKKLNNEREINRRFVLQIQAAYPDDNSKVA